MNFLALVKKELFERKQQLFTSFCTILLGITAIVGINNITHSSEKAVKHELERLGANVLILPKEATVQDYYTADLEAGELPEAYVAKLSASGIHGMENLSPKLSAPVEINAKTFIMTGMLPKNEIRAKAVWQGSNLLNFGTPLTGTTCPVGGIPTGLSSEEMLSQKRFIESLKKDQIILGYDAASSLGLSKGSQLTVKGTEFSVVAILPPTGTVDDSRIFGHLHTVQQLWNKPGKVNVIEVIGCCQKIMDGLVPKLNALLPEAKVVTIGHVVETQLQTNQMMTHISWIFFALIVLVGGASIANYMYGNVQERKKEIGTLMAIGADSRFIMKLFGAKALCLGLAGGLAGYVLGTALAMFLGPYVAGIPVYPLPGLFGIAIAISIGIALLASFLPARRAAMTDPCIAFREV